MGKAEERHCITFMRERRSDHWQNVSGEATLDGMAGGFKRP